MPLTTLLFLQTGLSANQPTYFFPVFIGKRKFVFAVAAVIAGAAVLFAVSRWRGGEARARPARPGFVQADGVRFTLDGKLFRFAGANVAVMFRDDDRRMMGETL